MLLVITGNVTFKIMHIYSTLVIYHYEAYYSYISDSNCCSIIWISLVPASSTSLRTEDWRHQCWCQCQLTDASDWIHINAHRKKFVSSQFNDAQVATIPKFYQSGVKLLCLLHLMAGSTDKQPGTRWNQSQVSAGDNTYQFHSDGGWFPMT